MNAALIAVPQGDADHFEIFAETLGIGERPIIEGYLGTVSHFLRVIESIFSMSDWLNLFQYSILLGSVDVATCMRD